MKDKELRIYEILYGGICMSLPIFFCPGRAFSLAASPAHGGGFLSL